MALLLRLSASQTSPADPQGRRPKILRNPLFSMLSGRQQHHHNISYRRLFSLFLLKRKPMALPATQENVHLMEFLQQDCPEDVLPKILAFCGPQKVAALSQTCSLWRDVILDDSTWRILCEELYKWSEEDSLPSTSWREYYQQNPCVPIDYATLPAALAIAETPNANRVMEQTSSIRVLLRPGDHLLSEAIVIQATEGVSVTIETMKGNFSTTSSHPMQERSLVASLERESRSPTRRLARRASNLRSRMNCRSASRDVDMLDAELEHPALPSSSRPPFECASLVLQTRKHNEPLLRIKQGTIRLKNLDILHNSHGMDIWNGNSAIQIQPPPNQEYVRPCMYMDSTQVLSHSGRGIVNIDGGYSEIVNCHVHNCAATGIYVGGPGTQAVIERSDVLHNGNGTRNRRGVGRGHSGVYLEQGKATIRDCNISRNSLTGISAVSRHNTVLQMEASDLVANGAAQLEMPRGAPLHESMDLERNNRLAAIGLLRSRSGLVREEEPEPVGEEMAL